MRAALADLWAVPFEDVDARDSNEKPAIRIQGDELAVGRVTLRLPSPATAAQKPQVGWADKVFRPRVICEISRALRACECVSATSSVPHQQMGILGKHCYLRCALDHCCLPEVLCSDKAMHKSNRRRCAAAAAKDCVFVSNTQKISASC